MAIDTLRFSKLRGEAIIPTRKHPQDAGLDLYAAESKTLEPHQMGILATGIAVDLPDGYVGLVMSKSRNNFLLGGGVVDAGYQGEILVKVFNVTVTELEIQAGQAIAQLLILPIETPETEAVPIGNLFLTESERGQSGGIASQNEL
mgnify:CR=1 FL=1